MKKIYCVIFFLLIGGYFFAQNTWSWARSFGGSEIDASQASTTDGSGNTFVCGHFRSATLVMGSFTLNNTASPNADLFIAKIDPTGNVTWATSAVGSGSESATAITTDGAGNLYIAGNYAASDLVLGTSTLSNPNSNRDVFVAKYNSSGNVVWAKSCSGDLEDFPHSIAVDQSGGLYVTGYFESTSLAGSTFTLTNTGITDMFLLKYDSNGGEIWAKNASGTNAEIGSGVATDASGNVYVTGYFYSQNTIFGTDTLKNTSITNPPVSDPDGIDMFLVKYNSSGNVLWARKAGGAEHEQAKSITISSGNIYVGGIFNSTVVVVQSNTITNSNTNLTDDIFLFKYDDTGNMLWARKAGGTGTDYIFSVKGDGNGSIYLCGQYNSPVLTFGSFTVAPVPGNYDAYLAGYTSGGNVSLAYSFGGSDHENALSVSAEMGGDVYVTGFFDSPTMTIGSSTLTSAGNFDIFFAKLSLGGGTSLGSSKVEAHEFALFPNPGSGEFKITLGADVNTISVYNITGAKINADVILDNEHHQARLTLETAGVYFIKIESENGTVVKKMIVK